MAIGELAAKWLLELITLRMITTLEGPEDTMAKLELIQVAAKEASDAIDALIAAKGDLSSAQEEQVVGMFHAIRDKAKAATPASAPSTPVNPDLP